MEKLIEYLNEYEEMAPKRLQRKYYSENCHIMYIDEEWEDVDDYRTDYEIISKDYRFIQWLVDNDKIDEDKVPHNIYHSELVNDDYRDDAQQCIMTQWKKEVSSEFAEDEELLMLLAISDTPIDDLISYLR